MEAYNIDLYSLDGLNKDIDIRSNLLNKTWRVFNDSDIKETYTFSEDGKLTIIKDGVETTSSWKLDSKYDYTEEAIIISENILYPSYRDNVLFVLKIPEQGNVFLIDEKNELSIIPTTRQDLYDYFQKADLVYNRFSYPVSKSNMPFYWILIWILAVSIFILLLCFFEPHKLAERILVEFGVDNNNTLSLVIMGTIYLLFFLLFGIIARKYSIDEKRRYERDLSLSKEQWIDNNYNDDRWKQYGYSLFIFCPYGKLRRPLPLEWNTNNDIGRNNIGFYDKEITTRDQLLKVDNDVRMLRKEICKKTRKISWGIIYSLIALVFGGIIIAICQSQSISVDTGGIPAIVFLITIFGAIAFGIMLLMKRVVVPYIEYKRNCNRIKRWIKKNPTDWKKKYVMYINFSEYLEWWEL